MSESSNSYMPALCKRVDHPWCHTPARLWLVVSPIFLTIGTIGNILSICILLRKRMRQNSASIYLTSLAIADSGVLYLGLLREWLVRLTEMDYQKENDLTCKLQLWLQFVAFNTSVWLLAAFTVDRQISVVWPIFAKTRCSRKIRYLVVGIIPIATMVLGSHYFLIECKVTYQWSNITNTSSIYTLRCEPTNEGHIKLFYDMWPMILFFTVSFLPAAVIFISNIRILKVILSRTKRVAPGIEVSSIVRKNQAEVNRTMNSMLIAVSVFYIISTLPMCVYILISTTLLRSDTPENVVLKRLFWAITSLIFYSNSAVNFLLYCFSGSLFRLLLKETIISFLQFLLRKLSRDRDSRGNVASATAGITTGSISLTLKNQPDSNRQTSNESGTIRSTCMPNEPETTQNSLHLNESGKKSSKGVNKT